MKHIFLSAYLFLLPPFLFSQTVNLQQVVGSGITEPVGVYFAPGNDSVLYILEQGGVIRLANARTGAVSGTPFLNITSRLTSAGNEQGLLGLAFHPNYTANGYFFVNYTKTGGGATVVARYKCSTGNPLVADPASEDVVMQVAQPFSNHNGGQLQFGRDGYLYIGLGDGGSANDPQGNGQNGMTRLAKMMRVAVEDSGYTVPADNPFVGQAGILPEIWSLGLRNPWRYSFDQKTADLWIADVGQNVWEEIDFEPANTGGRNYGWRCYEGNVVFNGSGCGPAANFTAPIYVYNHSGGNCSVTGGFVYRGGSFSDLYGKYIFTDYCTGKFWATSPNGLGGWNTVQLTVNPTLTFQITSFGQDSRGEMYVVSRDNNRIYRMSGTACASADLYSSSGSLESCTGSIPLMAPYGPNNTYTWYRNDTLLTETSNRLTATRSGIYKVVTANAGCGGEATAEVTVGTPTPVTVSLPSAAMCEDAASATITVSVPGGTLSGPGVSGNTFDPSGLSGPQQIRYSYTNVDHCTSADTFTVTVNAVPVISFTPPDTPGGFCLNDQAPLTATPAGGTFSGPGVSGNSFVAGTAGVGTHTITYSYTDGNGCSASKTGTVRVVDCYTSIKESGLPEVGIFPNPSRGIFRVQAKQMLTEIRVFAPTGQLVYDKSVRSDVADIDLTGLAAGTYHIQVISENGRKTTHSLILEK